MSVFSGERDVETVEDDPDDIPLPSVPAIAVPANPGFAYVPNFYGFFPDFDLITRIKGLCRNVLNHLPLISAEIALWGCIFHSA